MYRSVGSLVRGVRAAVGLVLAAALLAACGGAAPAASPRKPSSQAPSSHAPAAKVHTTTLTVGILPILPMLPLSIAEKQGYFRKQDLHLQIRTFQGGALAIPAVLGHQVDIAYSNYVSLVQAVQAGAKLEIIAGGTSSLNHTPDPGVLLVGSNSPIHSLKQVAGKRIGLNTLRDIEQVSVNRTLEKAGVNPKTVHFVEAPWQDQANAYQQGSIDVLAVVEPFRSVYMAKYHMRPIGYYYYGAWPHGAPLAGWVVDTGWARSHAGAIQRFVKALSEGVAYMQAHSTQVPKLIETFDHLPPPIAEHIVNYNYSVRVNAADEQQVMDAMYQQGFLKKPVRFASLLASTAR